jgi:predicted RND superfamily exporter protein
MTQSSPSSRLIKGNWHWLTLLVTGVLAVVLISFVDLKPQVGQNFFFATDNPAFQQAQKIEDTFQSQQFLIMTATSPEIDTDWYMNSIEKLSEQLLALEPVIGIKSISEGPKNLKAVMNGPMWKRLLIAEQGKATNILIMLGECDPQQLIPQIEKIMDDATSKNFELRISGPPYIVEMIRRNLVHDFALFSSAAVALFGLMIAVLFRSWRILLGTMTTCLSAVILTLIVQQLFGMKIGLLTANLTTIVFVLTLSHIIFMTGNWRKLEHHKDGPNTTWQAWKRTASASSWCMVTTLLGFASLLMVQAKPLRELGIGGTIGTLVAMLCAYLLYPPFLSWIDHIGKHPTPQKTQQKQAQWTTRPLWPVTLGLLAIGIVLGIGIKQVNTDPSLLAYFSPGSKLHDGLSYIDRNGGSSPLKFVVQRKPQAKGSKSETLLNNKQAYEQLWDAQQQLEEDPAVGTIISLPVLMAQAKKAPFAILLPFEMLLDILEKPSYDRTAKSFITEDRVQGLFMIRMIEQDRHVVRLQVIDRLKKSLESNGFEVPMVGGLYYLQGELAALVEKSLIQGLLGIVGLFAVVAMFVSRNFRATLGMVIAVCIVPAGILGIIGWFKVPLDVISAPAANVCIGMAVDAMIHLTMAARKSEHWKDNRWQAWCDARKDQWHSILNSAIIVCGGFGIFALSSFPPTQRFGIAVVFGTVIAAAAALFVLPVLAGYPLRQAKK